VMGFFWYFCGISFDGSAMMCCTMRTFHFPLIFSLEFAMFWLKVITCPLDLAKLRLQTQIRLKPGWWSLLKGTTSRTAFTHFGKARQVPTHQCKKSRDIERCFDNDIL
jgi:hypothetical protein